MINVVVLTLVLHDTILLGSGITINLYDKYMYISDFSTCVTIRSSIYHIPDTGGGRFAAVLAGS